MDARTSGRAPLDLWTESRGHAEHARARRTLLLPDKRLSTNVLNRLVGELRLAGERAAGSMAAGARGPTFMSAPDAIDSESSVSQFSRAGPRDTCRSASSQSSRSYPCTPPRERNSWCARSAMTSADAVSVGSMRSSAAGRLRLARRGVAGAASSSPAALPFVGAGFLRGAFIVSLTSLVMKVTGLRMYGILTGKIRAVFTRGSSRCSSRRPPGCSCAGRNPSPSDPR